MLTWPTCAGLSCLQASDRGGADSATDAFEAVFLRRAPFVARHDAYVAVPFTAPCQASGQAPAAAAAVAAAKGAGKRSKHHRGEGRAGAGAADAALDRERCATLDLPPGRWLSRALPRLLAKALGDRHTLCVARCYDAWAARAASAWPSAAAAAGNGGGGNGVPGGAGADTAAPSWRLGDASVFGSGSGGGGVVVVGLDLDGSRAARLVDRGPPADDAVLAPAFRSFWGEKSELRRFKDGAIVEAVLHTHTNTTVKLVFLVPCFFWCARARMKSLPRHRFLTR